MGSDPVASSTQRRATVADARACAEIVSGWLEATAWLKDVPDLETLVGIFETGIPMREIWVIGDPVAAYMSIEAEISLIHGFYTRHPGSGAGKTLMDHAKSRRDYLQLWTHEPNTPSHRFYHREGFAVVERKPEGRGDGVPELRMEWHR